MSDDVLIMTCGKCGGTNIVALSGTEKDMYFAGGDTLTRVWSEKSICLDCGAECEEIQIWEWEE